MPGAPAGEGERRSWLRAPGTRDVLVPATLSLLAGVLVLLLRPAVPVDETRYLAVFRESTGSWVLWLDKEVYTEKTPLLFWLADLLRLAGLSATTALRIVPAIASAVTVAAAGVLGRRLGAPRAGWLQAALLMPLAYSQYLLFDPLLAACVWCAFAAGMAGKEALATAAAALALLAKGPAALLYLGPLAWTHAPLRGRRLRLTLQGLVAVVPVLAWALATAWTQGPEVGRELLWERWGGRIEGSFAHAQGPLFYLPILLAGALPATPLLFLRRRADRADEATDPTAALVIRRLPWALGAIALAFSLISGKQPHYVLPLFPGIALLAAVGLERDPRGARWLGRAVLGQALFLATAFVVLLVLSPRLFEPFGPHAEALEASGAWWGLLAVGGVGLLLPLVVVRRTSSARARLAALALASVLFLVPVHHAAGRLAVPRDLGAALAGEKDTPLALVGSRKGCLYTWLAGRDVLHLEPADTLAAWCEANPGGLVIASERERWRPEALALSPVLQDQVAADGVFLYRVPASGPGRTPEDEAGQGIPPGS